MKKSGRILALMLGLIIFLQSGLSVWAAETEAAVSMDGKQKEEAESGEEKTEEGKSGDDEEAGEEDDGEKKNAGEGESDEKEPEADEDSEEDQELLEYIREAQKELKKLTGEEAVMALVYLCDSYEVKATPDFEGKTVASIPSGSMVLIKNVEADEEFNLWYQVSFEKDGASFSGYVLREYLAYANERFIEWENTYFPQISMFAAVGGYPDVEQFPAAYQDKLARLKQAHPNWIFVRQNTNLDWQKVVSAECSMDRSLINETFGEAYRREKHSPGWYYASEQAVAYYLDPRNFLDESRIFQFEQLTYNSSYHTKAAVQNILKSTFMKGEVPGAGMTYAEAFFQIGVSLKVSPFHLACRVYQEQGEGKSALISGNYTAVPEYKGYYNYYNVGAFGKTTKEIVESGLARAVKEGWNSHYASLKGGAGIIAKNYILRGQDTLYLQKFDVDGSDGTLYTHQYMQNITAPYTESSMVKKAYVETGALNNPFVFKIPVYNNMPSAPAPVPSQSTARPTATPTAKPTATPTAKPTATPTAKPTATPTAKPTATPTAKPTAMPTAMPTATPGVKPVATPTAKATPVASPDIVTPIVKPTETPTAMPTAEPTTKPTTTPTARPTAMPTTKPTVEPGDEPDAAVSAAPTATSGATSSVKPSEMPKASPGTVPTKEPAASAGKQPAAKPTAKATAKPAQSSEQNSASEQEGGGGESASTGSKQQQMDAAAPSEAPAKTDTDATASTGKNAAAPVSVAENTSSSGITVAAATPKPHTASEDKKIVTMDMSRVGMLYAQTLKQISEQGMEVVLEVGDKVSWTIDGSTIDIDSFEDINLNVTLGSSEIPKDRLKMLTENEQYIEMSLAHSGEFGFTIKLSVELDDAQPGQYANLFYYNEKADAFEFMCAPEISSAGIAGFEFRHASDYVIIVSDSTKEDLLAQKAGEFEEAKAREAESMAMAKEELPAKEPGKAAGIIALILLGSAALGIGVYLIARRKDED